MRQLRRQKGQSAPADNAPIREFGRPRAQICTRVPKEIVDVLSAKAGERPVARLAGEILTAWAKRHAV